MPARSSSKWVRIGVTAVAAVVVAEAAAWLLRPRDIESPVHVDEDTYFSHEELSKARAGVRSSGAPSEGDLGGCPATIPPQQMPLR